MPELPEVETTRQSLLPYLPGARLTTVTVRNPRLRWPVPEDLPERLQGQYLTALRRRGKYLLLDCATGSLILHLGMSGSLRLVRPADSWRKHDHLELALDSGWAVRLHDPRRFGACLWSTSPGTHPLLASLGVEPLGTDFTPAWLAAQAQGRRLNIKALLMDAHCIVGVGNIYANEALFLARLHPDTPAGQLTLPQLTRLHAAVQQVLTQAIAIGGTTLRDYVHGQGETGYFQLQLAVYGRNGLPCLHCQTPVQRLSARRATFCCPLCQAMPQALESAQHPSLLES